MDPTTPEIHTILLCDDEQAIRRFVRTLLTRHGYQVLEAKDGKHALTIAEAHNGPIHLLLSDVMMPELDGPGLAKQLKTVRPELRVILMSADWVSDEKCPFVQKPFLPSALVSTIRRALEPLPPQLPV